MRGISHTVGSIGDIRKSRASLLQTRCLPLSKLHVSDNQAGFGFGFGFVSGVREMLRCRCPMKLGRASPESLTSSHARRCLPACMHALARCTPISMMKKFHHRESGEVRMLPIHRQTETRRKTRQRMTTA